MSSNDDSGGSSEHTLTCPLCEAMCGLRIRVEGGTAVDVPSSTHVVNGVPCRVRPRS